MRMARGISSTPPTSITVRKAARRAAVIVRPVAESSAPVESAVNTAMRKMAMMSSTISTPNTMSVTRPRTPCSLNALTMIVVLEIAIAAPA